MFIELAAWFLLLGRTVASQQDVGFTYNGFGGVNLSMNGLAHITDDGLLMLVNTSNQQVSHAFYPNPLHLRNSSTGNALSFSTTFVFFIRKTNFGGPGFAFVIGPSTEFPGALPSNYFGLFNLTNVGNTSNHVIAIELDTLQNEEFDDINGNHVGIDINGLKSIESAPASYFSDEENRYVNLTLADGDTLQLWVEYDGGETQLNVTLAPITVPKPTIPLLSTKVNLSEIIVDPMFVGFSSATYVLPISYYVLGWSFQMNGEAKQLSLSQLHKTPQSRLFIVFSVIGAIFVLISVFIILCIVRRKRKFLVLEDWEPDYRPHRFKYKYLNVATEGFNEKLLLGTGGFGRVYRGVLPTSKTEVAVKRISKQWEKAFSTEIISNGKLRHRNIVPLLGYCRHKGELLLVYEFMPNGSLDKLLFDQPTTKTRVSWDQRFRIIKSVADALSYLHEEWEQIVVHRDVKSSNVLLDKEMNGRLGDFGLARLYDHGANPQTTHIVGTLGYLAPELGRTGKANPSVDVFAFGAFLLEVACGRRPIEPDASAECTVLVDWVTSCWSRGSILDTVDPKLGLNYKVEEMELVLKLGLLCSHSNPTARPHMREVLRYLEGEAPLPEETLLGLRTAIDDATFVPSIVFGDVSPYTCSSLTKSSSVTESALSEGR